MPFNLGMVGVWYNKALFEKAGIDAPPATWSEFLEDVEKLKAAGITPIAVGGDKWPAMFWYAYLSLIREGGEAMTQAGEDAGLQLRGLRRGRQGAPDADRHGAVPDGFLAAPWPGANGEAGTMAPAGRDGPDGPVGAGRVRRQHEGPEGPRRRPRLVPVPAVEAVPARRASSSAVATGSPSAGCPPTRPSSS